MTSPAQQRVAPSIARARAYLEAEGAAFDGLRLAAMLGEADSGEVRGALEALQSVSGAFEPLPGRMPVPAVDATLEGLLVLGDARVRRAACVERAVGFLAAEQRADGSWGDEREGVARMARTARVAGALARSVYTRPAVLAAAADFLSERYDRCGEDWGSVAGLCAFFSSVDHESADRALQWSGRALERGFRAGRFSALQTVRVLTLCDAVGLPAANLEPAELVRNLLSEQADDGGWPAQQPEAGRPAATLDAVGALLRLPA